MYIYNTIKLFFYFMILSCVSVLLFVCGDIATHLWGSVMVQLSILAGILSLVVIALFGQDCTTGQLVGLISIVCGSLVYPLSKLIKE